jgi:Putative Actinobacterial Holin-X, holin superfamily III
MAIVNELRALVSDSTGLLVQHAQLAQQELASDAQFVGRQLAVVAACAPLIVVGYGFLCVALVVTMHRVVDLDLACLLVGLLNVALGGGGIALALKSLQKKKMFTHSSAQLNATLEALLPKGSA